jgi:hypothetical protein
MSVHIEQANPVHSVARCFRCPQERRGGQAGWHFLDVPDRGRWRLQMRVYVCPLHYAQFAGSERARWTPLPPSSVGPAPVPAT